jgi:hypothetical protein
MLRGHDSLGARNVYSLAIERQRAPLPLVRALHFAPVDRPSREVFADTTALAGKRPKPPRKLIIMLKRLVGNPLIPTCG